MFLVVAIQIYEKYQNCQRVAFFVVAALIVVVIAYIVEEVVSQNVVVVIFIIVDAPSATLFSKIAVDAELLLIR